VVFGPAYLDTVIVIEGPLVRTVSTPLDQSLSAVSCTPRTDGLLQLSGPTGDLLELILPADSPITGASYQLREPLLARVCAGQTIPVVTERHDVRRAYRQLGGMGAGYAKAFDGILCAPFGQDALGETVQSLLAEVAVAVQPTRLPSLTSDQTLIILSEHNDKLAIGERHALLHWTPQAKHFALAARARVLVFCGATNAFAAAVLAGGQPGLVMYAPSMRNIDDAAVPLHTLAPYLHYLALNALEWSQLAAHAREALLAQVPLITVTEGPRGSRVFASGRHWDVPAAPAAGPIDTNRAGETYAATFLKAIVHGCPLFPRHELDDRLIVWAATVASRQAARQLSLTDFAFPADDWSSEPPPR
jgi:sugar/nucleoside kinase (ribokinase family)